MTPHHVQELCFRANLVFSVSGYGHLCFLEGHLQHWLLSREDNRYGNLLVLVLSTTVCCFHCICSLHIFVIPVFGQQ